VEKIIKRGRQARNCKQLYRINGLLFLKGLFKKRRKRGGERKEGDCKSIGNQKNMSKCIGKRRSHRV